jgi:hypothetical protein
LQVTQQARRELLRRHIELGPPNGHILGLRIDGGAIKIEPRQPGPAEVVVRDGDAELLFVDHGLHARLADSILHFRSKSDGLDGSEGWVLLKSRGTLARPGLDDSLPEAEPDRQTAGVWRFVRSLGAVMHPVS